MPIPPYENPNPKYIKLINEAYKLVYNAYYPTSKFPESYHIAIAHNSRITNTNNLSQFHIWKHPESFYILQIGPYNQILLHPNYRKNLMPHRF